MTITCFYTDLQAHSPAEENPENWTNNFLNIITSLFALKNRQVFHIFQKPTYFSIEINQHQPDENSVTILLKHCYKQYFNASSIKFI